MNESFRATIHFGLLVLAMLFVANLAFALREMGGVCVIGSTAAIIATAAAYLAQHFFTLAAQHDLIDGLEAETMSDDSDGIGKSLQRLSIAAGGVSGVLFLIGAV